MKKKTLSLIVGMATTASLGIFSSAFAGPVPSPPYVNLGGLDLAEYCKSTFGNNSQPVVVEENAYGWRCLVPLGGGRVSYEGMNLNRACQVQYNDRRAASGYLDWDDVYSWICWRGE
ncbi:MAG: hypothetical protein ACFE0J_13985 [Elainellaceae cyanobacterium]